MKLTKILSVLTLLVAFSACSKKEETDTTTTKPTLSAAKQITAFSIDTAKGIIDTTTRTIILRMPDETDLTKLTPTIVYADKATISPTNGAPQDFTKAVVYTVRAEDGSSQTYTVKVFKPSDAVILSFSVLHPDGNTFTAVFDSANPQLLKLAMSDDQKGDAFSVKPVITVSPGATISPASGAAVDLSKPVTYKVTSEKGDVKEYTLKILNNETFFYFSAPYKGSNNLAGHDGYPIGMGNISFYADDIIGLSGNYALFDALETEDVSNITLKITVPTGMTITPAPSVPQNFNKDVTYTLKNEVGVTSTYTIRCIRHKGFYLAAELFADVQAVARDQGSIYYWAEAPVEKIWLVNTNTGVEYPVDIYLSSRDDVHYSAHFWVKDVPAGIYLHKAQLPDGTVSTSRLKVEVKTN